MPHHSVIALWERCRTRHADAPPTLPEAGEPLPARGKRMIVTDWSGEARALIETTIVSIRRFADVPASFAAMEGEGDGSLAAWREAHRAFWARHAVDDDFLVICEEIAVLLIA